MTKLRFALSSQSLVGRIRARSPFACMAEVLGPFAVPEPLHCGVCDFPLVS